MIAGSPRLLVLPARAETRREQLGLLALLAGWLAYTRVFPALQAVHVTLPACPFYTLTGHPCPFCGGTRAYAAMWRGGFVAAFRYHPLGPLLFALTFGAAGYALWAAATGRRLFLRLPRSAWGTLAAVAGLALTVSWSLKLFWLGN